MQYNNQKLYRVEQYCGKYFLHINGERLFCGDDLDDDSVVMNFISFSVLSDIFDVNIARLYCWEFGVALIEAFGDYSIDGFTLCGMTVKKIASAVKGLNTIKT